MRQAIVRMSLVGMTAGVLWGCAPLTEQERYEFLDRRNQAREAFLAREEQCERHGGMMQMRTRPLEKPGHLDYQAATCIRR